MRSALPRLAGSAAAVLGSVVLILPLVSGAPAAGATAAPAPGGVAARPAPLVAAAATLVAPAAARPVTPEVDEVPVPEVDRPAAPHLAAVSSPQPVEGFGLVGATWQGRAPGDLGLQVRTKDDGVWSDWSELPYDEDHGPDPGTAEAAAANVRPGSDPVVVGDVDQVQVRATTSSGEAPRDLELSVVDPGVSPADDDPATVANTVGLAAGAPTSARTAFYGGSGSATATQVAVSNPPGVRAPKPRIRSRAAWGANERLRSGSPSYGTVKAGFVHHTVNSTSYSRAQVPGIIRSIYAYHTQSNGWSDIGYNFLVDRFGRIWQGRYGDIRRNVIGAHTYGYNHVSFAMSAIGNFEVARPSRAMLRSYGKLMGWKLGLYGISAGARRRILEGRRFRAINGHRDAGSTACPGDKLYDRLPAIRRLAVRWQRDGRLSTPDQPSEPAPEPTEPKPTEPAPTEPAPSPEPEPAPTLPKPDGPDALRDLQADGFPDLLARDASTGRLQVLVGDGGPGFGQRSMSIPSVGSKMLFTGVGDVTGDGRPDLLVRNQRSKTTAVRPGRANGLFGAGIAATGRFAEADVLAGVGNMVGTRRPDVVMREADSGRIWLFPGRSQGRWGRKQLLIRRGAELSMITGAGDLDGNGRRDLVARDGRALLLYPGRAEGRVGAPRVIDRGWGDKDLAAAGYDVTGDARPDLVARDRQTRRTWIYVTRTTGAVAGRFGGWKGWGDVNRLTAVGDVTGDEKADLLGRTDAGALMVLPSRGTRWLQGPIDTGELARAADFAQVVGDWNGDGHTDVVTRSGGTLWLYRGTGGAGLRSRVVLRRDWGARTFLVGPGDLDRDGDPDLVSRTADGTVWVHTSNSARGIERRYVAREKMFRADMVTAAGFWNNDGTRDLVVRRARTKELYLVPGRADGTLGRPQALDGGQSFAAYDRIVGVGYFNRDRYPDIVARERDRGRLWLFAGSASGLRAREYVASGMGRYDLLG